LSSDEPLTAISPHFHASRLLETAFSHIIGAMEVRFTPDDMPVYKVRAFSEGKFTEQMLNEILKQVQ
jgi:hypothetical protein